MYATHLQSVVIERYYGIQKCPLLSDWCRGHFLPALIHLAPLVHEHLHEVEGKDR